MGLAWRGFNLGGREGGIKAQTVTVYFPFAHSLLNENLLNCLHHEDFGCPSCPFYRRKQPDDVVADNDADVSNAAVTDADACPVSVFGTEARLA